MAVQLWKKLAPVMPCGVITEIFVDHLLRHVAFLLNKLVLHSLVVRHSYTYLTQVHFNDPQSVVPAVEVAFVTS